MRAGTAWLALGGLLLAWSPLARAHEVLRTDGGHVLEVSGFYKSFVSGAALSPGLVEGTAALQDAFNQAGLPASVALPPAALLTAQILRGSAVYRHQQWLHVEAAYQLTLSVTSSPAFAAGASLTGTVAGAGFAESSRRLVPLGGVLLRGSTLVLDHGLDRLLVRVSLPFGDLTVGRQVLSWGTGRVWNPTDVLSPFPPTVVDREVRRGFDAVRLSVGLSEVTQLDLLYLPQQRLEDQGGVVRLQTNVLGWDGSLSAGKYLQDVLVGLDVVGDLGPVSVHAEGAYTWALQGLGSGGPVTVGEHFFRGVVGADVRPVERLFLSLEYHYNGFGAASADGYAQTSAEPRVVRGEVFGAGRHYLALAGSYQLSELLTVALASLTNLQDPSAVLIPSLEYSLAQAVLLRVGASIPLGAAPDVSVFRALTGQDVLTRSLAFTEAQRTFGLRSEFGAGGLSAFVQLGMYLP